MMMITCQCDALVGKFNVAPLIIGLVAPICLRFLALSLCLGGLVSEEPDHDDEVDAELPDVTNMLMQLKIF
ncbi:hypothetical protein DY000_02033361 [Brassica cretica]|uniref:Uncharacterized protein n=1 Tax=Brassica cretica TaxID=69181 RepID=A0ABQ7DGN7_BRACR|nr:hypothetical protein DY000_02033361 [Brassica cretica]